MILCSFLLFSDDWPALLKVQSLIIKSEKSNLEWGDKVTNIMDKGCVAWTQYIISLLLFAGFSTLFSRPKTRKIAILV